MKLHEMPTDIVEALNFWAAVAYHERASNSRIDKFKWLQRIKLFSKRKCN
jgi:hypothetical protein